MTPAKTGTKFDVLGLSHETLVNQLASMGEKPFRARQIMEWVYKKQTYDFAQMSNLAKVLRDRLVQEFRVSALVMHRVQRSQRDGRPSTCSAARTASWWRACSCPTRAATPPA